VAAAKGQKDGEMVPWAESGAQAHFGHVSAAVFGSPVTAYPLDFDALAV